MQKNREQVGDNPCPDEGRDASNAELVQLDSFFWGFGL